ncbi:MAG: ral secretion pathway protein [Blastocatellia bacterium]|nr:ral secretion pathway protein [Blastocatellia bacterium]
MERSTVTGKRSKQEAESRKHLFATVFVAALPPDVRKGWAFQIASLPGVLRGYASRGRQSLHSLTKACRKAGGFPHLKRQSRELSPVVVQRPALRIVAGFTLLELMIVISIIIILASIALPQYQKTIMHARETVLRDDLFKMRSVLDQYAADKGKLPQSLDDLVTEHYLREIPKDPITDNKDWAVATGDDVFSTEGGTGVTDVHSASGDVSTEGTPYSEW